MKYPTLFYEIYINCYLIKIKRNNKSSSPFSCIVFSLIYYIVYIKFILPVIEFGEYLRKYYVI